MKKVFFSLAIVALLMSGCYKDDIDDLKKEQERHAQLLQEYKSLLDALGAKKTITSVAPISDGWKITFSDNTTVDLKHGKDGDDAPYIVEINIVDNNVEFIFSEGDPIVVPMTDYSNGIFIVNEGSFPASGSVNFFRYSSGRVETGLYSAVNPGKDLGVTTQFAAIYNEKMYLISKQGALVVVDAKTMLETGRIDDFEELTGGGRAFCGVTAGLGLVSTADGVYKLNLNPLSLGDKIDGISGEVGEMLQYRQHIFIYSFELQQIYAMNTSTWTIDETFDDIAGGLTVSKDGMIWSANGNDLIKINPFMLDIEMIPMPTGVSVMVNGFGWAASSLTASKQENALYFVNDNDFWDFTEVYKYVIGETNSLNSPLFTVPSGRMIYGTGINVHPQNNQVVVTTIDGWAGSNKNNLYFYDGTTGRLIRNVSYDGFWFPAMILFPEN